MWWTLTGQFNRVISPYLNRYCDKYKKGVVVMRCFSCPPLVIQFFSALQYFHLYTEGQKRCKSTLNSDCHCYSTRASVWVYCCTWSLACSLGNHTDNQHLPCTYWPGVFEGNDNVSISPILSSSRSSSSIVSSVTERLGVSTQDPSAARPERAGSSWDDPGLVLLQAGLEESVTWVPGRAALPPAGLEIAAVSGLQKSVRVLEVTDLKLEHPNSTNSLSPERGEGREGESYINILSVADAKSPKVNKVVWNFRAPHSAHFKVSECAWTF